MKVRMATWTAAEGVPHADAYMKGSLQFEGPNTAGSDGYAAGFGVIAIPTVEEVDLKGGISWPS
jgi:hypothetical protein